MNLNRQLLQEAEILEESMVAQLLLLDSLSFTVSEQNLYRFRKLVVQCLNQILEMLDRNKKFLSLALKKEDP